MDAYRSARRTFLLLLAVALGAAIGVEGILGWFSWFERGEAPQIPLDLARLIAVSSILYGSYHLLVEWAALGPDQQAQGVWRKDYVALQRIAYFSILLAYALEALRSIWTITDPLRVGWVVRAWGAGFVGGLLLFARRVKLKGISSLCYTILILSIVQQSVHSIYRKDASILLSYVLVMSWSFAVVAYFPFVVFPTLRSTSEAP